MLEDVDQLYRFVAANALAELAPASPAFLASLESVVTGCSALQVSAEWQEMGLAGHHQRRPAVEVVSREGRVDDLGDVVVRDGPWSHGGKKTTMGQVENLMGKRHELVRKVVGVELAEYKGVPLTMIVGWVVEVRSAGGMAIPVEGLRGLLLNLYQFEGIFDWRIAAHMAVVVEEEVVVE